VIVPDLNLVVYAYNADAPLHARAKAWWEGLLNGQQAVRIPWAVILGFIRLMTHRAVLVRPLEPLAALEHVRAWLAQPNVEIIEPGPRHLAILEELFEPVGVAGDLTTDAHLAAIAIEHQCELHSNDRDFERFSGLRQYNPLHDEAEAEREGR
jgi:hypothetical protein